VLQVRVEYKRVHSKDEEKTDDNSKSNAADTVAEKMTWDQSNPQDDADYKTDGEMTSKNNPHIGIDHKMARERIGSKFSPWSDTNNRTPIVNYMKTPLSDVDLQVARARGLVSSESEADEMGDTSIHTDHEIYVSNTDNKIPIENHPSDNDLQVARARGLVSPKSEADNTEKMGDKSNPESKQNIEPFSDYAAIDFKLADEQSRIKNS